jgi:hypothetical protein
VICSAQRLLRASRGHLGGGRDSRGHLGGGWDSRGRLAAAGIRGAALAAAGIRGATLAAAGIRAATLAAAGIRAAAWRRLGFAGPPWRRPGFNRPLVGALGQDFAASVCAGTRLLRFVRHREPRSRVERVHSRFCLRRKWRRGPPWAVAELRAGARAGAPPGLLRRNLERQRWKNPLGSGSRGVGPRTSLPRSGAACCPDEKRTVL